MYRWTMSCILSSFSEEKKDGATLRIRIPTKKERDNFFSENSNEHYKKTHGRNIKPGPSITTIIQIFWGAY